MYLDSFGIEYIPIFRILDNESTMCGFYSIVTLLDYTNLFSPNDYQKNDKIIYKHFKNKYGRRSKYRV